MTSRLAILVLLLLPLTVAAHSSEERGSQNPAPSVGPERNPAILALEREIAGREQTPAEQVFKNIQTFKGMPAIRVLRIMEQAFVPNLGVECTYCHVDREWASDDKRTKVTARGMWTLRAEVQELVRKVTGKADATVTCYTCHKGAAKPTFAPAG
jgi:hypothetical protein